MPQKDANKKEKASAYKAGLLCRCPACNKNTLYNGLLTINDHCPNCNQSFANHEAADGPAYIAICLVGGIVTTLALFLEIFVAPPLWVHAVLWLPLILGGSIYCLRMAKSLLISLQYMYKLLDEEEPKKTASN